MSKEYYERVKEHAFQVRDKYQAGLISYSEAKKELKEYIDLFNKRAEEIAKKYNQKPKKMRLGEFLKMRY